ncbi:MAG: hypothetical protein LBL00_07865 [Endomicrobium sp.]|jgi:hypothetical protein|nr:hypothetical protein [Endomicrobium sp.]
MIYKDYARNDYIADGVNRVWNFDFDVWKGAAEGQIELFVKDSYGAVVKISSGLSISMQNKNVTYPVSQQTPPVAAGMTVIVARYLPVVQNSTFTTQGAYTPKMVEAAVDYEMMISQQIDDHIDDLLRGFDSLGVDVVKIKRETEAARDGALAAKGDAETARDIAINAQNGANIEAGKALQARLDAQGFSVDARNYRDEIFGYLDCMDMGNYSGLLGSLVNYGRYRGFSSINVHPADYPAYELSEDTYWELEVLPYYNTKPATDTEKGNMIQRLTVFTGGTSIGWVLGVYTRSYEHEYNTANYYFSSWEKAVTPDDINYALNPVWTEFNNIYREIAALKGLGGYLTAYDFGSAAPTQQQLTDYALAQIGITDPTQIFNGTRVKNLFDDHLWILTNTPATNPPVFDWADDGHDTIDVTQFVLRQSETTQIIDSDVALAKGKKLLGTKASGAEAIIAEYAIYNEGDADQIEQVEIGSETEHLNLNTSDNITYDTPDGKNNIFARKIVIDTASTSPEISLSAGVTYVFTQALTELTIDAAADSDNEIKIYFTAGDGFSLILPAGFDFDVSSLVDQMPQFDEGRKYMVSVDNGIFAFSERA